MILRPAAPSRSPQPTARRTLLAGALLLLSAIAGLWPGSVGAQATQPTAVLFEAVNRTVVVVRVVSRVPTDKVSGTEEQKSLGSGVVVSAEGQILTAAHLVRTADEITVEFLDGSTAQARVSGSAPDADLSLLTLEAAPPNLPVAQLGDSDAVAVGDSVIVIGAPYGLTHTLSQGIVSGRHVPPGSGGRNPRVELFQTDAAINTGNSGGPMFNLQGQVIGIVSSILSKSGGFEGIGFAVTSNTAKSLLLDQSSFWTGVDGLLLESELAGLLNVPQPGGLLVQHVAHGSPADQIGLQPGGTIIRIQGREILLGGDIILSIAGIVLDGDRNAMRASQRHVQGLKPGDRLTMVVLRKGQRVELSGIVN